MDLDDFNSKWHVVLVTRKSNENSIWVSFRVFLSVLNLNQRSFWNSQSATCCCVLVFVHPRYEINRSTCNFCCTLDRYQLSPPSYASIHLHCCRLHKQCQGAGLSTCSRVGRSSSRTSPLGGPTEANKWACNVVTGWQPCLAVPACLSCQWPS